MKALTTSSKLLASGALSLGLAVVPFAASADSGAWMKPDMDGHMVWSNHMDGMMMGGMGMMDHAMAGGMGAMDWSSMPMDQMKKMDSAHQTMVMSAVTEFAMSANKLAMAHETAWSEAEMKYAEYWNMGKHAEARDSFKAMTDAARDHEVSGLYEARNKLVDVLNQHGMTAERDWVLKAFDATVTSYVKAMDQKSHDWMMDHEK